jgi:hypothetical protein
MIRFIKEIRYYLLAVVIMLAILPDRKNQAKYFRGTAAKEVGPKDISQTSWIRIIDEGLKDWNRRGDTGDELSSEILKFFEKEFLANKESEKQIEEYMNDNAGYFSSFVLID